jgi:hypothetical protein
MNWSLSLLLWMTNMTLERMDDKKIDKLYFQYYEPPMQLHNDVINILTYKMYL